MQTMAGRRGSNLPTPYQDGDYSFGDKFYTSSAFMLDFIIMPWDASQGVTHASGQGRGHLQENLDLLKALLQQNPGLQTLSYEIDTGGTPIVREIDFEVLSAVTNADYKNKRLFKFSVLCTAPRPFWRELPLTTVNENTITSFPHDFNIDTAGNAPIGDLIITIDVDAASSTPSLEVVSTGDKITVNDGSLVNTDQIIIDLGARTFTKNAVRADSLILRETAWFMRLPAADVLAMRFDATSGDYDLQLDYYKKWL